MLFNVQVQIYREKNDGKLFQYIAEIIQRGVWKVKIHTPFSFVQNMGKIGEYLFNLISFFCTE